MNMVMAEVQMNKISVKKSPLSRASLVTSESSLALCLAAVPATFP